GWGELSGIRVVELRVRKTTAILLGSASQQHFSILEQCCSTTPDIIRFIGSKARRCHRTRQTKAAGDWVIDFRVGFPGEQDSPVWQQRDGREGRSADEKDRPLSHKCSSSGERASRGIVDFRRRNQ